MRAFGPGFIIARLRWLGPLWDVKSGDMLPRTSHNLETLLRSWLPGEACFRRLRKAAPGLSLPIAIRSPGDLRRSPEAGAGKLIGCGSRKRRVLW